MVSDLEFLGGVVSGGLLPAGGQKVQNKSMSDRTLKDLTRRRESAPLRSGASVRPRTLNSQRGASRALGGFHSLIV